MKNAPFENLEDVSVQNVSQKYIRQLEKEAAEDRLEEEQRRKEDEAFRESLNLLDY